MATSANFVVSSLPDYVQTNRDLILKNFGLVGNGTRSRVSIQTGIKKSAYLNFLNLAPVLQDGTECSFDPQGSATLTQREINVAMLKVDMDICPRNLIGKYAEYLVRVNATEESLPFEQYIMDGVTAEINKKIEKWIWQADSTSLDAELALGDGWLKQMANDASVVKLASIPASAYEGILAVYMAMTEETLERGGEIFVSPAIYRAFLQEMVVKNYFHYAGAQDSAPETFILPGTDVKVVKTPGLAGKLQIVGTFAKNLVYGTDMENDAEDIDLWYSKDGRQFKLEALWTSGAAYYFPDQIVYASFAAAPGLTAGINESLAKLASTVNADGQVETHPNE